MVEVFSGSGLTARSQVIWDELLLELRVLEDSGAKIRRVVPKSFSTIDGDFLTVTDFLVFVESTPSDS